MPSEGVRCNTPTAKDSETASRIASFSGASIIPPCFSARWPGAGFRCEARGQGEREERDGGDDRVFGGKEKRERKEEGRGKRER